MSSKRKQIAVAGVAAAVAAAVAVPALTTAQSPEARTITVQEKNVRVAMDDVAPKSTRNRVSLGDRLITRQSLFDAGNRATGTLYTDCTGVGPTKALFGGARLLCTITYTFADGQLTAAGVAALNGKAPVAIVGGTGAYANAHGTVQTTKPAKGYESADIITITG